uniref:IS66 family transposase n=1 Tax=Methylomonas albis TaxID=1854563 RepID=UPI001CE173AB|nr:IS66 family transposase [Methylomonas albis]
MSDGYEVYNAIAAVRGATHFGCRAHARRYFVEAETAIPTAACEPESLATQFIVVIGEPYAIEVKAKDLRAEQRGHQEQSRPVLANIEAQDHSSRFWAHALLDNSSVLYR